MPRDDRRPALPRLLSPEGQSWPLRLAVLIAFALATAFSIGRVVSTLHDPAVSVKEPQGLIDFHHVIYWPAVAFRDGVNPYSQEYAQQYPVNRQYPLYSPGMFVLHYPYAYLSISAGNVIYFVASFALVIMLAVSAIVVCRVPKTVTNVLGLSTLILLSRPGHVNLLLGQFTLPIALGGLWAMELARRRPALAGLGLALTTLKPTFGVPFVWLMICRRDYRAAAWGIILGGTLAAAGLAPFVLNDGWKPVLNELRQSQSLHEADPIVDPKTTWTRLDALALIAKLMPAHAPSWLEFVVAAVCLLGAGWAVWRTSREPLADGADNLYALLISSASLACIYHSTYDALLLVAPWVGASVGRLREQLPAKIRPIMWGLLTIPAINYFSAKELLGRLSIEGPWWTALTALNSLCVVAVLLLAISIAFRPRQHGAS